MRDLGASGEQVGGALTRRRGGPKQTPLSNSHSALCCRPVPLAPAHALRSPAPHEVTPTALIIFCFAPRSVFHHQLPAVTMATRRGGGGAAEGIPGPGRGAAPANFSGSPGPAGPLGKRAVTAAAPLARRASGTRPSAASARAAAAATGPGAGTTRLSLDPAAQLPDAGAAGGPLAGHARTHTRPGRETQPDLGAGARGRPRALCSLELADRAPGRETAAPCPGPWRGEAGGGPGPVRSRALSVPGPEPGPLNVPTWGPAGPGQALCRARPGRPGCLAAVVARGAQVRLQGCFGRPPLDSGSRGQKAVEAENSSSGSAGPLSNAPAG